LEVGDVFFMNYLDLLVEYLTYPILPEAASSPDIILVLLFKLFPPPRATILSIPSPMSRFGDYLGVTVFLSSLRLRFSATDNVTSLLYSCCEVTMWMSATDFGL
jgi:hypothetical protein